MRFTAYLYLPNTVAVADYWNIWQTKTRFPDGSSDPVFIINGNGAVDPGGTWQGFGLFDGSSQRSGGFQIRSAAGYGWTWITSGRGRTAP